MKIRKLKTRRNSHIFSTVRGLFYNLMFHKNLKMKILFIVLQFGKYNKNYFLQTPKYEFYRKI